MRDEIRHSCLRQKWFKISVNKSRNGAHAETAINISQNMKSCLSVFLSKINDMLKSPLTRLHRLRGLTLLIVLLVQDEPKQAVQQSGLFVCLFVMISRNTLLWFISFLCSGSRWTHNHRCNDICLIRGKCCFTFPPSPLAAVPAVMSASENVCFTFTASLLCNYVNLMRFGCPKNSSRIYKNVVLMLPCRWLVVAG